MRRQEMGKAEIHMEKDGKIGRDAGNVRMRNCRVGLAGRGHWGRGLRRWQGERMRCGSRDFLLVWFCRRYFAGGGASATLEDRGLRTGACQLDWVAGGNWKVMPRSSFCFSVAARSRSAIVILRGWPGV